MENDVKKEAGRQYLHYFRFWFIGIGVLALLCIVMAVMNRSRGDVPRTNREASAERVYDYADVLTDQEEENLRQYIAETEKKLHIDIVLVTFSQSVEGADAMAQYGLRSQSWEHRRKQRYIQ